MSAFIGRSNGNGDLGFRMNTNGNGKGLTRQSSSTPLQKFVEAKNRINNIFSDIEKYIHESFQLLKDISSRRNFVPLSYLSDVEQFEASIKTIKEVLLRDHMKVVFFGRTSNGKSTVMNAMLYSKVLPSGLGHTTKCFVQVEGSSTGEKYILTEGSDEPKGIDSIDSLAHALCSKQMGEDSLVRVFWPKNDSKLLQNEVVLVDSPGIDVSPEFDCWIDKHCLDADVFVLVSNAESTLTQTEKKFFFRVNDKLSRPNIFILNNRWDASAVEPELMDKVREQHMKQFIRFLVEDLAVCSVEEAKDRIFFVSAREMLLYRLKSKGISASPGSALIEGFPARMLEFESFERQFELCISQSAIQTKFESHIAKGKHIATCVYEILENLHLAVAKEKEAASNIYEQQLNELIESQAKFNKFVKEEKKKIQQLAAEVQLKVSAECYEEIMRLEGVIDAFRRPFLDEPPQVTSYKQELINHVDQVVTDELQLRCTGGLLQRIIEKEKEMVANCSSFLPANFAAKSTSLLQFRDPFKFSFAIHCNSLLTDFREDLEFRFSLGVTQLIKKFVLFRDNNTKTCGKGQIFGSGSFIPRSLDSSDIDQPSTSSASESSNAAPEDAVMHSLIYTSANYVANGGIGLLLIGGFLYRSVGWRLIAFCSTAYGLLYLYERLSWNKRAKERALKAQMRRHLCYRLNQQSQTITMNCENQVTREVSEVLNRLQELTGDAHREMKKNVDALQQEVKELEQLAKTIVQTKGNGKFLCSEFDNFWHNHLQKAFTSQLR